MTVICPTVLAKEPDDFREQMERIATFAERIQIDLTDGLFAGPKSIDIDKVWWPHGVKADLHLMYHRPDLFMDKIIKLRPHMVIVHSEAEGDLIKMAQKLQSQDIKFGLALLKDTEPETIKPILDNIDHVLIFSGNLGHFGGHTDFSLLKKVKRLKNWKPELEIGWDGGITDKNAQKLIDGGIDVLNVGGFIQNNSSPENAYATLKTIVGTDMKQKLTIEELELKANAIREDIIKMLEAAGSGHSAGPLGLADIFTALYFDVMKYDPKRPDWNDRDILLLSNGHCVPVQYATMAHAGYFDRKELMTLRKFGSRLQGHPEREKLPGLENTSGPLGCGLSQAAGMALAMRMNKDHHHWIYVVMGDGEQDEGNVWEAAMLAAKYKLNNIIAITDRNNIQIDGSTETVMPLEDLKAKWEAFGWHVIEIDGNNIDAVIDACAMGRAIVEKPVMIIAHTIPGKGVDFMEYDFHWHGSPPNHEQAVKALHEIRTLQGKIRSEHE